MQPFFDRLEAVLGFDCTVPEDGGNRDDAIQLRLWAIGRALKHGCDPRLEANWTVTHRDQVVTYALSAEDSAHGHGGGADVLPVRTLFANGLPATVWLGTEENPADRAEAVRLQGLVSAEARAFLESVPIECGADWPAPKTDGDHYQVANWRELPRL
jgi:hypothetical protein